MHYFSLITDAYPVAANPGNAVSMKTYMRNQFEYLGISSPERRAINKGLKAAHGLPDIKEMPALTKAL